MKSGDEIEKKLDHGTGFQNPTKNSIRQDRIKRIQVNLIPGTRKY